VPQIQLADIARLTNYYITIITIAIWGLIYKTSYDKYDNVTTCGRFTTNVR